MLSELANLSVHNLLRARARLFMTAGGVLVGTCAVILLIALTVGLQTAAEAGIGQNQQLTEIRVYPGYEPRPDADTEIPVLSAAVVRSFWDIPGVEAVVPVTELRSWAEIIADDFRTGGQIVGIDPALLPYMGITTEEGALSLLENQALVGALMAENFFDPDAEEYAPVIVDVMRTPLELNVYSSDGADDLSYDIQVSGTIARGSSFEYSVILPIQRVLDMNEFVNGPPAEDEVFTYEWVFVRATSRETTNDVSDAIRELGFEANGIGDFLRDLNSFFTTMRIVLGGVGGVALLVAAFGVANTMTMAILERTREIGLMKAIGATDRDILTVFLFEAGLVGLFGGIAGVGLSFVLQNVVNQAIANLPQGEGGVYFLPFDPAQIGGQLMIIPPELAAFALILATSVGIVAGFYPSLRAARMTTVTALKTE